jgi:O-antigen ligase
MLERRDFTVAAVLLCLALAVGGAGSSFPRLELLIELVAIGTLLYFALTPRQWRLPALSRLALAILALVFALPLIQLIPLPPGLWTHLPGRELATQVSNLVGTGGMWRPLSLNPEGTVRSLIVLIPAAAMLVATLFLPTRERLRLVWVVVILALISAAMGAVQFATGGRMTPYPSAHQGYAIGLFVNRNHQAALLLMAIPLAAALGAGRAARLRQPMSATILTIAGIGVLALTVVATTSRMGLALIPVAGACGLFLLFRARANWRVAAPALLGVGLLAVVTLVSGMFGRTLARFSSLDDARFDYWRDIDWALHHYGLAGTGFGTFVPLYQSAESLDLVTPTILNHAHNDYLELALEGGWPALALLVLFLSFLILAVRRLMIAPSSLDRRLASLAALAAILIVMIFSVVDYPLRMPALSTVFALLCGLLLPTVGQDGPGERQPRQRRRPRGSRHKLVRRARTAVLLAIAVVATWTAFAANMSSNHLIGQRYDAALRWAPWSATAHEKRATESLLGGNLPAAAADARTALALSPMSLPAIRTLGIIDSSAGQNDRSFALMGVAAVLGWRDTLTQMWVMQAAIRSGEGDKAVQRAEAMLRQDTLTMPAFTMLIEGAANKAVLAPLVQQLAQNPDWRRKFLVNGGQLEPKQFGPFETILLALKATRSPPTPTETTPFIRRLTASGEPDRAAKLWGQLRGSAPVANGEFEQLDRGDAAAPTSWDVPASLDIKVAIARPPVAREGNALHAYLSGTEAKVIAQSLMLAPGRYQLIYWIADDAGSSGAPVAWEIACRGQPSGRVVSTAQGALPSGKWRPMQGVFDVPIQDCSTQELRLRWTNGAAHVRSMWIDGVNLRQLSNR